MNNQEVPKTKYSKQQKLMKQEIKMLKLKNKYLMEELKALIESSVDVNKILARTVNLAKKEKIPLDIALKRILKEVNR